MDYYYLDVAKGNLVDKHETSATPLFARFRELARERGGASKVDAPTQHARV